MFMLHHKLNKELGGKLTWRKPVVRSPGPAALRTQMGRDMDIASGREG